MKPTLISGESSSLSRRDFLKFLPMAGSLLLLVQCERILPLDPTSQSLDSTQALPSTSPPTNSEITSSITPPLAPINTTTLIKQPTHEYLPEIDGTYSSLSLPEPFFSPSLSLFQALRERQSSRTFRTDELPLSIISNLLWAGFGVNRQNRKRTAPSANNVQDIDLYLATGKGLFLYEAQNHYLVPLMDDDLRSLTGSQEFAANAPLNFVYVSNYTRINAADEDRLEWSWAHSGCIAQNVYLACSVMDLATVVRSSINRPVLAGRMGLNKYQHITLSQTLGYPA